MSFSFRSEKSNKQTCILFLKLTYWSEIQSGSMSMTLVAQQLAAPDEDEHPHLHPVSSLVPWVADSHPDANLLWVCWANVSLLLTGAKMWTFGVSSHLWPFHFPFPGPAPSQPITCGLKPHPLSRWPLFHSPLPPFSLFSGIRSENSSLSPRQSMAAAAFPSHLYPHLGPTPWVFPASISPQHSLDPLALRSPCLDFLWFF